jgi:adenine-specific DNA-methyltransferase
MAKNVNITNNAMSEKDLQKEIMNLKAELKRFQKNKLGLYWEEKTEDIVELCKNNVPVLKFKEKKKGIEPYVVTNEKMSDNLLIEGDNYHALSVLNYTHKKKFDVIYIDPPYNTGAKDWKYNNDYVDEKDAYRHSKWISMMNKRLQIAKDLLKDNGVLIVTIDDYEIFTLLGILENLGATTIGRISICIKPEGRRQSKYVMEAHEYAIFVTWGNPVMRGLNADFGLDFPEQDEISKFRWEGLMRRDAGREDRGSAYWYPFFVNKDGDIKFEKTKGYIEIWPINTKGIERVWLWDKERAIENISQLRAVVRGEKVTVYYKRREQGRVKPTSFWYGSKYNANAYGTRLVQTMLPETSFDYPKSIYSVLDCIDLFLPKDGLVLDFFAGSGTTGHATLMLNQGDEGSRRFILCTNNENNIAEEVTYRRIVRAINGYKSGSEKISGLGGNLRYYKTDLVNIEHLHKIPDEAKIRVTYQAGEMIAVREDTLNEVEKNEWWQTFEGHGRMTAIYFKEDKSKLAELIEKLEKKGLPVALYIFSWGKNEYRGEYSSAHIRVEDIPEPILEVYKEINRL